MKYTAQQARNLSEGKVNKVDLKKIEERIESAIDEARTYIWLFESILEDGVFETLIENGYTIEKDKKDIKISW